MTESKAGKKPVSLHPLSFKEAVTCLLKTAPRRAPRRPAKEFAAVQSRKA